MKKLLLYISLIVFAICSNAWGADGAEDVFVKEIEALNSEQYNGTHVARGRSAVYSLRYTIEKEKLGSFQNIISNPLSNDKRFLNKMSVGTFHLIEKNKYGLTYEDYNVYFGNESVVFKFNNFLTDESVYIMTQMPYTTFNCIDGNPVDEDWIDTPAYMHWGFVKVDKLVDEDFYTFPYFEKNEPSVAIAVGYTSVTGRGVLYYLIFSTTSNKYYISDLYGCGEIDSEIPSILEKNVQKLDYEMVSSYSLANESF